MRCSSGRGGTGKSHLAQAIGQAANSAGLSMYFIGRRTSLLDELADAVADGSRKEFMESLATVPLLIIDDFGMRKLPLTAAEDLLEIVMRRYERASTLVTSNRPVEDWGKLLGDVAAVAAMLDPDTASRPRAQVRSPEAGAPNRPQRLQPRRHRDPERTGISFSRQQGIRSPLFRFPSGENRGGRVPPTPPTARLPPQEGFQNAPR